MIDSIAFYYINWPIARGIKSVLDSNYDGLMSGFVLDSCLDGDGISVYTGNWENDIAPMDKDDFGGLKSNTISLYL